MYFFYVDKLVGMNIFYMIFDEVKKFVEEVKVKKEENEYWKIIDVVIEYIKDLEEIK